MSPRAETGAIESSNAWLPPTVAYDVHFHYSSDLQSVQEAKELEAAIQEEIEEEDITFAEGCESIIVKMLVDEDN